MIIVFVHLYIMSPDVLKALWHLTPHKTQETVLCQIHTLLKKQHSEHRLGKSQSLQNHALLNPKKSCPSGTNTKSLVRPEPHLLLAWIYNTNLQQTLWLTFSKLTLNQSNKKKALMWNNENGSIYGKKKLCPCRTTSFTITVYENVFLGSLKYIFWSKSLL